MVLFKGRNLVGLPGRCGANAPMLLVLDDECNALESKPVKSTSEMHSEAAGGCVTDENLPQGTTGFFQGNKAGY